MKKGNKSTLGLVGPLANSWRGGRIKVRGRSMIYNPTHPRASVGGKYVFEHILIVEKALTKSIPFGAVIHHVDGNPLNNKNENLVLCDSQAYHVLLHVRARAHATCGNKNWVSCRICLEFDDPKNLTIIIRKDGIRTHTYHKECVNKKKREKQAIKRSSL